MTRQRFRTPIGGLISAILVQSVSIGPILNRHALALAAGLAIQGLAASAHAQTYDIHVTTNVDLGVVTSGLMGDSVFRVDPATGSVSRITGDAVRSGAGSARALVTISCTAVAPTDCTKNMNVRLGVAGSPTKRARTLTRILFSMGTASLAGGPGPPGSGTFIIGPIGANSSKTFYVGADFGVAGDDSGLPTGDSESDFFVYAAEVPAAATSGDIGRFTARVIRSIAIAKTSDLIFGRIVKPALGSGTVTIDPATGARTVAGGLGLDTPIASRATFNVTGEGGQAFSITVPASFQMTGPQTALTVTTATSAAGSPVLSQTLGAQGAYAFGVGGSFALSNSTPSGDYSGSLSVTVSYN